MTIQLIDWDPIVVECDACTDGTHGDHYCDVCQGDGIKSVFDRSELFTLSHNLMIGAALCSVEAKYERKLSLLDDILDGRTMQGRPWPEDDRR